MKQIKDTMNVLANQQHAFKLAVEVNINTQVEGIVD